MISAQKLLDNPGLQKQLREDLGLNEAAAVEEPVETRVHTLAD
jgi:hypothetical protein